ncbi:hypothetical protein [Lacticaseibacillus sp. GG6-2]
MRKWAKFGIALASALSIGISVAVVQSFAEPQQVQAAKTKYTKKNVKKLKLGMTKKKVKKMIGAPQTKTKTLWTYMPTDMKVSSGVVEFKKGKVSGGTVGTLAKQSSKKKSAASAQKLAPINTAIAKSLKQDQGFAAGTLDANGKPTTNGTPNASFDWSTYVISIKVSKSGSDYKVQGQVGAKVNALTDDSKKGLALHIQNLALATLSELNKASDEALTNGLFTDVKSGKLAVVQSHLTDYKEFRVY